MNEWLECDLSELRIQYRDRLADLGFAHRATMAAEAERDAAIARAERAEAALRTALDSKEVFRICWEEAEADCRRVVSVIPWRALASIYAHPGVVLDADADAIGEFLDQYADEWAGGFELRLIEEKQLERQAEDYALALLSPDQEGA